MNILNLFKRVPAAMPPTPVVDPAPTSAANRDPKVAFEVEGEQTTIQVVYPCRTRHLRVEPEAQVYVLIYRDFGRALRYVDLHGSLRKQFGSRVDMWTVDSTNRRDDDLMADAVADAKEILFALRHPIEAKAMPDPDEQHQRTQPVQPYKPVEHASSQPVVANSVVSPEPDATQPIFVREGMYVGCGMFPWKGADGQTGKASFAAVIKRTSDGKEDKLFGSDLDRVIREAKVMPGDLVRFSKYPKVGLNVGGRIQHRNIWQLEFLEDNDHGHAPTRH